MNNKIIKTFKIISLVIALVFSAVVVSASNPTTNPPLGNTKAPIDLSATFQTKDGSLVVASNNMAQFLVGNLFSFMGTPKFSINGISIFDGVFSVNNKATIVGTTTIGPTPSTDPGENLQVYGNSKFSTELANSQFIIGTLGAPTQIVTNSANSEIQFSGANKSNIYSPDSDLYLLAGGGKTLNLGSDGVDNQIVLKDGKLGIGVNLIPTAMSGMSMMSVLNTPGASLHITDGISTMKNLLSLKSSEPKIIFDNNASIKDWAISVGNDFEIQRGVVDSSTGVFVEDADGGKSMILHNNGSLELAGFKTLTAPSVASLGLCSSPHGTLVRCSAPYVPPVVSHGTVYYFISNETGLQRGYVDGTVFTGGSYPNPNTFTIPTGVTEITVQVWGAGGRGEFIGGGAGAFSAMTFNVNPGDQYYVNIGRGGVASSISNLYVKDGGDSSFCNGSGSLCILAGGGKGGANGGFGGEGSIFPDPSQNSWDIYRGGNGITVGSVVGIGGIVGHSDVVVNGVPFHTLYSSYGISRNRNVGYGGNIGEDGVGGMVRIMW